METTKKKLVLIDSNALLHRAYHALPPLSKKDGTLTNAVYGYALTLLSVLERFKPDYIVATFDLAGPTFRHEQYADYKATRKKAPDEFYSQIPMAKELLKAFNIPIYEKQGYEADDVIGTIAKEPRINGSIERIIVTGDLDTLQLVDEHTKVFTLRRGITDTVIYDTEKVRERYGLEPSQMIEYKALRGDQSDNIPGVKGIGEKTAIELLLKYKDVDTVYANIDHIASASVKKKLTEGKEYAYMSRQLATIDIHVPVEFDLEQCHVQNHDMQQLLDFLREMEFFSLAKRISGKEGEKTAGKVKGKGKKGTKMEETRPVDSESTDIRVEVAKTKKAVGEVIAQIRAQKKVAFSLSATQDKYYQASVVGMVVLVGQQKRLVFIPAEFVSELIPLFSDPSVLKIGYNLKFDYELLRKFDGGATFDNFFDVQIAAYLLRSGTAVELDKLVFEEFGKELEHRVVKKGQVSLLGESIESRQKETAERAFWIWRLYGIYKDKIIEISKEQAGRNGDADRTLAAVFERLELPLVPILAEMEMAGVRVQKEALEKVSAFAEESIKKLEKKIYQEAGAQFNINSTVQLAEILYDKLEIPTTDIKRGKTGFSTDADQLRKVRDYHPIIALIEQYRELFKIKTTYTDALPLLVEDDGRIHANFNQAVTATGRLSSSEPNMQNIPKRGKLSKLIRQAFVAREGCQLVAADYSQIDLRAAAHLSADPRLIEAFTSGQDIHRATAGWVNGIPAEQVTDQQRSEAKSLNFGVLYGMGTYGFMRDSGVSRQRAEQFIEQYMKRFSNLKKFLDETKEFAHQYGYVETELGRRRYIANINAANYQLRAAAERMAINLPVQGLSADIMKLAMIAVSEQLLSRYGSRVRLILQIHDELIFEVEDALIDEFMARVKTVMEKVYELKVPLVVEVEKGRTWAEV